MGRGLSSRIWPTSRSSCAGRDYSVLDRPEIQSRLHLPADQQFSRSESGLVRQLDDCPDVPVGKDGCALPRRGRHPCDCPEKEPYRAHPQRYCLRALFTRLSQVLTPMYNWLI